MTDVACIAALYFYPVKSARGIELPQALLHSCGLRDDRRWMVVTPAGNFLTQRALPRLALLRPQLSSTRLLLQAPQMPPIAVPLRQRGPVRRVRIWNDECEALDEGDAVAHWLRDLLECDCRLVRFAPTLRRLSSPTWTGELEVEIRFADAFPLLTLSMASLADLNSRLPEPLPMDRFRPNLVLEGLAAYEEDRIAELHGDGLQLRVVKPCVRCKITTTNQDSACVAGDEPLRTLRSYRYDAGMHGVCFGQNLIIVRGAGRTLERGQRLEVRWKEGVGHSVA